MGKFTVFIIVSFAVIMAISACQPEPAARSSLLEPTTESKVEPTSIPTSLQLKSTAVSAAEPSPTEMFTEKYADLVLKNGFVYTVDKKRTEAQALAFKGKKIIYVGDDVGIDPLVGNKTKVIDLKGKMVLPGFIDSHIHAADDVDKLYSVSLSGLYEVDEYKKAIKDYLTKHPDITTLMGSGWDNTSFPPEGPSKEILDELVSNIPVVLFSIDGHSTWVNSKALELSQITRDTPNPEGGIIERDKDGNPSGTLREEATNLIVNVLPDYTLDQIIEGIKYFQDKGHTYGLTTVFIPGLDVDGDKMKALSQLDKVDGLTMRFRGAFEVQAKDDVSVVSKLVEAREQEKGGLFEVNSIKLFMDGVIDSNTAYLEQSYAHKPDYKGELLWKPEKYNEMCAALDKAGFEIHVHSVGDASTSITLDGFAYARKTNRERDSRHAITHLQLVKPDDIKRFAEFGVVAVPQPYWFVVDYSYDQAIEYIGKERADQQYPMKSFFNQGVVVASASDYPVTIHSRPLVAIESGITRATAGETDPEKSLPPASERVTLDEMIASFTINGAYANFLEKETGSLEVGKMADLVVLDKNLFDLKPNEISTAKELLTIFEGKEVFRDKSFE
jgi:predicted amidohydrolase YtcJ